MAYGVKVRVWGDYACFTRPEMKVERVSYDVMTPSAARGILEAIYWKPEISWVVDRIHVLRPIRFMNIRRNEVEVKASAANARTAMKRGEGTLCIQIEEHRQQRASLILKDVEYVIEAHFDLRGGEDNPAKHHEMFLRRLAKGQAFHRPYLGCREFAAHFANADDIPVSVHEGQQDLGFMLHDIDFTNQMQPRFFRAIMRDGIIDVPSPSADGVRT